jgi:iron complex transport system substrate-binding protein
VILSITDDLGRTLTLRGPARRVVSLSPAITENLYAVGAGGMVVGVTTACDYPKEAKGLPRVGDFGSPAYERIRALKPDLAIVEIATVDRATVENAEKRMGVPILVQCSRRYADVPRHLEQLGVVTGQAARANARAKAVRLVEAAVTRRVANAPRVSVFVEVSASPLYAAGPGSFVDDLIRLAGGTNVVKGTNPYPQVSRETLLVANPKHYVIAGGGDMGGTPGQLPPPLNRIAAAREGNLHRIASDLLFRPTPRLADGLRALANALHPERR